jgi:arylsulfatase A-like enzyme
MVTKLDSDVGRIVQQVHDLGLDNDTYILFTSDNGAHNEGGGDAAFFNSSGPLRGIKRDLYEGGIHVPFIVKCPADRNKRGIVDGAFAFWDIQPTLCELADAPRTNRTEGISFLKALLPGEVATGHKQLYWQFAEGELKEALIREDWKLIRFKQKGKPEVLELYNLGYDHGEVLDLAKRYPVKLAQLKAAMLACRTPAEHPDCDYSEYEQ